MSHFFFNTSITTSFYPSFPPSQLNPLKPSFQRLFFHSLKTHTQPFSTTQLNKLPPTKPRKQQSHSTPPFPFFPFKQTMASRLLAHSSSTIIRASRPTSTILRCSNNNRTFQSSARLLQDVSATALPVRKPVGAFRGGYVCCFTILISLFIHYIYLSSDVPTHSSFLYSSLFTPQLTD